MNLARYVIAAGVAVLALAGAGTASAAGFHHCPSSVATVEVSPRATCAQARQVMRRLTTDHSRQQAIKPMVDGRRWYCTRNIFNAEFLRCGDWPNSRWVYATWKLA